MQLPLQVPAVQVGPACGHSGGARYSGLGLEGSAVVEDPDDDLVEVERYLAEQAGERYPDAGGEAFAYEGEDGEYSQASFGEEEALTEDEGEELGPHDA